VKPIPNHSFPEEDRASSVTSGRDPDFLIIGAMKAGTTSLFRWISSIEDVRVPDQKEMDFFSGDNWERGFDWYREQFPVGPHVTGEASPSYTHPAKAGLSASRIHDSYPHMPMIFLARDPTDRARSHYRHSVQRGRENRRFEEAASPDSDYVVGSLYSHGLEPYLTRFPTSQILILTFERLTGDSGEGWASILDFLGLTPIPRPTEAHNRTDVKRRFSRPLLRLWEAGLLPSSDSLPDWLRRLGQSTLTSDSSRYRALLESSSDAMPVASVERLEEDRVRLSHLLGTDLWG
jgi:hypothetical protein